MVEIQNLEKQFKLIAEQHAIVVKNMHSLSLLQQDIAKQMVQQHEEVQALYLALGLKKELSYYSFNISNMEEH